MRMSLGRVEVPGISTLEQDLADLFMSLMPLGRADEALAIRRAIGEELPEMKELPDSIWFAMESPIFDLPTLRDELVGRLGLLEAQLRRDSAKQADAVEELPLIMAVLQDVTK